MGSVAGETRAIRAVIRVQREIEANCVTKACSSVEFAPFDHEISFNWFFRSPLNPHDNFEEDTIRIRPKLDDCEIQHKATGLVVVNATVDQDGKISVLEIKGQFATTPEGTESPKRC